MVNQYCNTEEAAFKLKRELVISGKEVNVYYVVRWWFMAIREAKKMIEFLRGERYHEDYLGDGRTTKNPKWMYEDE